MLAEMHRPPSVGQDTLPDVRADVTARRTNRQVRHLAAAALRLA